MDYESMHCIVNVKRAAYRNWNVNLRIRQITECEPKPLPLIGVILGDIGISKSAYDVSGAVGGREALFNRQLGSADLDVPYQVPEPRIAGTIATREVPANYDIRHTCHIRVNILDARYCSLIGHPFALIVAFA